MFQKKVFFAIMKDRGSVCMGILQPYHGTYCSADSASSKLDIDAILAGCNAVDEEANHISEYASSLTDISSQLDVNALSVNSKTISGTVQEYCDGINNVETEIMGATSQIREVAEAQYNQIQEQMNQEAYLRDQEEYNRRKNSN